MKQTTRTATVDDLRDLLDQPPRAYLAFQEDGSITAAPVGFRFSDGRYFMSVPAGADAAGPKLGQSAMLLIDAGWYSLELRGLRVRGRLSEGGAAPAADTTGSRWIELMPERIIGWDYGMIRTRGEE